MLQLLKDVALLLSLATNVYLIWFIGRRSRTAPAASAPAGGGSASPPSGLISAEDLSTMRDMLRAGQTIQAIKRYRELTGTGLADAKRAVEAMDLR